MSTLRGTLAAAPKMPTQMSHYKHPEALRQRSRQHAQLAKSGIKSHFLLVKSGK
jgi:hypothetical protein